MKMITTLVIVMLAVSGGTSLAAAARPGESVGTSASAQQGGQVVEVYLTSWCRYCKKLVQFLKDKGIPYTVHDVENDESADKTYRELGGGGVPLTRIGKNVIRGYNPEGIMAILNSNR